MLGPRQAQKMESVALDAIAICTGVAQMCHRKALACSLQRWDRLSLLLRTLQLVPRSGKMYLPGGIRIFGTFVF